MKLALLLLLPILSFSQTNFSGYPVYAGNDLGVTYNPTGTVFKIWAPMATEACVRIYAAGSGGEALQKVAMKKQPKGVWAVAVPGDIRDRYYTFQIAKDEKWLNESPDPYAKAVGVNGKRGMVVDLTATNPTGWARDKGPVVKNATDIVLYESHIRDFSVSPDSGIKAKAKFLGMTEKGTKSRDGLATGIDHLKELGITHIHLLPSFDFNSADESKSNPRYNWGYDPLNYNVPEGSYASDATDGKVRIREFKQMVQAFHADGIGVIMDVVYNHTANKESVFNQFAPDYFYRQNADGSYSNGTGCGNEIASERPMVQKFIIESVAYWATEYHVDGFRFDLMGVHDIETMNMISDKLHTINPSIFIYGEGWAAGDSPLPENRRAVKKNVSQLRHIAVFSDDLRDGLRGPFSKVTEKGFASGKKESAESVKFGIVAATPNPQIDYKKVSYSHEAWASEPYQTISYASCHDDNTLFDRLKIANPAASEAELIKMDKLSQLIVLTSQGVPFIHSGAELLRTKQGVANSYKSPDSINEIDWSRKLKYKNVFDYYRGLIALRKKHPAFRMPTAKMIGEHLRFIETQDPLLIAYRLEDHANGDEWKDILVLLNGDSSEKSFALPDGKWTIVVDGNQINEKGIGKAGATVVIPATTALVLIRQ
jgi:pullulanase